MQSSGSRVEAAPETTTAEDALVRLMMVAGRRFRARTSGDVIDPSHASVLYTLKCRGAMRLGDLADALKLDASTVSRHVQQLGDQGLIDREPDPEDGRARIIGLSDAGAAGLLKTFDERRASLAEALADWSDDDRARLSADLVRLTDALSS